MASPRPASATPPRESASQSLGPSLQTDDQDPSPDEPEEEGERDSELPLTMSASVVLSGLPKDAHEALDAVAKDAEGVKVTIRVIPLGAAPQLRQNRFKLAASKRFDTVIRNLRRRVGVKESESIFCYVHQTFSPAPDEGIGNLHRCFKINDELVVHYAITPAYG